MIYVLDNMRVPLDFSVSTTYTVRFRKATLSEVITLLRNNQFRSNITFPVMANALSDVTNTQIESALDTVKFKSGDIGIHFLLKGSVLSAEQLTKETFKNIGFDIIISEVIAE